MLSCLEGQLLPSASLSHVDSNFLATCGNIQEIRSFLCFCLVWTLSIVRRRAWSILYFWPPCGYPLQKTSSLFKKTLGECLLSSKRGLIPFLYPLGKNFDTPLFRSDYTWPIEPVRCKKVKAIGGGQGHFLCEAYRKVHIAAESRPFTEWRYLVVRERYCNLNFWGLHTFQ